MKTDINIDTYGLRAFVSRFEDDHVKARAAGSRHVGSFLIFLVMTIVEIFFGPAWLAIIMAVFAGFFLLAVAVYMGRDSAFEEARDTVARCLPRDGDELMPEPAVTVQI